MPSIRPYDEVKDKGQLASLRTQLHANVVVQEGVFHYFWCGGSDLCEEWFVDNDIYWARDIASKICF